MISPTLQARQLTCYREERLLFSDLNFSLQAGQGLFIAGPNGSGKTTLLRILAGLIVPAAGAVHWQQQAITEFADEYRAELAYLGHKNGIKLALTVKENLKIAAALHRTVERENKILLEKFNLHDLQEITAQKLSAGQKQRLALIGLLQGPAKLWLLDEPLTALDNLAIDTLQTYLQAHLDKGGMLVMASHQPLLLKNMARIDL